MEKALQGLKGVSSVAYTSGDPVALAKALSNWVKDNAEFTFKLGIVDGKVINVQEIQSLATLPGKEELFSKLLFLINSPAQRLATVINATGRNLAVVVNQAVEQNKFCREASCGRGSRSRAAAEPRPKRPRQPRMSRNRRRRAVCSAARELDGLAGWRGCNTEPAGDNKFRRATPSGALVWAQRKPRKGRRQPEARALGMQSVAANFRFRYGEQNGRHSAVGRSDR